jgi:hypothetical protein
VVITCFLGQNRYIGQWIKNKNRDKKLAYSLAVYLNLGYEECPAGKVDNNLFNYIRQHPVN